MADPLREYPTLVETIALIAKMACLPVLIPYWLLVHILRGSHLSLANDLQNRLVGYIFKNFSVVQIRTVLGMAPLADTMKPLATNAAKAGLVDNNVSLPSDLGFSAQWIHNHPNRKTSDPIVLYFHGGGFALAAMKQQAEFLNWLSERLHTKRVSSVMLDYTLTPFKRFPGQLEEAVRCLNFVSTQTERVILLADSCGANLALSLLAHQRKSHANVTPATKQPIFGVALISPWVSLTHEKKGSFVEFADIDLCSAERLDEFGVLYADPEHLNNPYANPSSAPAEFWEGLLPERTFVVWGEYEVLKDGAKKFSKTAGITETFEEKKGLHDCILFGTGSEGQVYAAERIASWL